MIETEETTVELLKVWLVEKKIAYGKW